MVKSAGVPAVASDRPCPAPVEIAPEVRAGKTVAWNGEPCRSSARLKSRPEGTISRTLEVLPHHRDSCALLVTSLYCTLTS